MDKRQAVAIAQKYAEEVKREVAPEQIILYGSYSAGTAHDDSDIDIAVIYDGFEGDFLGTSSLLWKLTRRVSSFIEPVLLDRTHDASGFTAEIIRTGEVLYRQA
jgi:predicted nucleotidyltransferase